MAGVWGYIEAEILGSFGTSEHPTVLRRVSNTDGRTALQIGRGYVKRDGGEGFASDLWISSDCRYADEMAEALEASVSHVDDIVKGQAQAAAASKATKKTKVAAASKTSGTTASKVTSKKADPAIVKALAGAPDALGVYLASL